ncbi:hypothetical protein LEM8419_02830 [Neolewinella maritima]|uniref:PD-(D/E)XK endonuclease-like domain-containing protein n=1 Tax=Neolewinella maritima TaxID=1383882 RepID=A0ABM9B3J9_9BACT|nr:PD-(D/E)XK nuclease family protein [Neolewinella maritima]CAH1001916.1 hypothetical protein LEM8419_02830 [Neolewinella maritima]
MIRIYLGLTLAGPVLPAPPADAVGERYLDYPAILKYLEGFYALAHSTANRDALRVEQYRQAVEAHLEISPVAPFYAAAFTADKLATAEELLSRRDELLEAGYPLAREATEDTPDRIAVLHALEALLLDPDTELSLLPGPADRLNRLLAVLPDHRHPPLHVLVHEPRHLLPTGLRRMLDQLEAAGDTVEQLPEPPATSGDSDLNRWQQKLRLLLTGETDPTPRNLTGDGSLVILRAERETHLAAYLARMVRDNDSWRPGVLMTQRNQTLDTAMLMEGLPSMGIPSTSLARPSLQVLKLVTAFLWDPIEVERIMEFVSLVTKPLDRRLGQQLAVHLADTPGLFGARWTFTVEERFRRMAEHESAKRVRRAREQYEFWFRRRRYPRDGRVPKNEVRSLFVFLRNWALEAFDEDKEQTGLLVLSAQSERATELLDAQPEADLDFLEVERLVRTIYQPAPTQFSPAEQGGLRTSFAPASTARLPGSGQPVLDRLVWWDFVETDPNYFFSRYYPPELQFLRERGCEPHSPEQRNELLTWQNLRPLLHTREQLVLCLPHRVDGTQMEPHALMGDLEAAFTDEALRRITVDIDLAGTPTGLLSDLALPQFADVAIRALDLPVAHLAIGQPRAIQPRENETPTAMGDLLYYPHKWVFRHQLKLRGTPILSIASENRLRGNLSHLFVEKLLEQLKESDRPYTQQDVHDWIDANAEGLLRQQGAVLLEYGQEPERVQFIRTMHRSAWTLVSYIQQNGWQIEGTELEIEGYPPGMDDQLIRGRADLVLTRSNASGQTEAAVVDLKWRGKSVFTNMLKNARDIQLALYADFMRQRGSERVHTAYYLLRDAKMLSRNELAFSGAQVVQVPDDYTVVQRQMLDKIRATYDWRWQQFAEGRLEVRCTETSGDLDDAYINLDHDSLLEMKTETSPFDDYQSLIGLIR